MGPLLTSKIILIARWQHLGPDYRATEEQLWPQPVWRGDLPPRMVLAGSPVLTGGVDFLFLLQGLLMSVRLCSSRSLEFLSRSDVRAEDDRESRERNEELVKKKTFILAIDLSTHTHTHTHIYDNQSCIIRLAQQYRIH